MKTFYRITTTFNGQEYGLETEMLEDLENTKRELLKMVNRNLRAEGCPVDLDTQVLQGEPIAPFYRFRTYTVPINSMPLHTTKIEDVPIK